jgi:hypothetical protein
MQVKLTMGMGGREVDARTGEPAQIFRAPRWVNRMDDLLSRSQASRYEGMESAVLFGRVAEEGANMCSGTEQRTTQLRLGIASSGSVARRFGNADSIIHVGTRAA